MAGCILPLGRRNLVSFVAFFSSRLPTFSQTFCFLSISSYCSSSSRAEMLRVYVAIDETCFLFFFAVRLTQGRALPSCRKRSFSISGLLFCATFFPLARA